MLLASLLGLMSSCEEKCAVQDTNKVLAISRIMVAWQPVGICAGVFDMCARYVGEREQFGAPLGSFQLVQEKLARMLGNIQAMFLMCWRLSKLYEEVSALLRVLQSLVSIKCTSSWAPHLKQEREGASLCDVRGGSAFNNQESASAWSCSHQTRLGIPWMRRAR